MPVFVLVAIWVCVSVLYVAQVAPMLFRYANQSTDVVVPVIGFAVSIFGLILESIADKQKSAQKKENPNFVATKQLYSIVRCPNYLGEIIFWTGVFISGLTTYNKVGQWIVAVLAYVCIVYIMFNGAQRLEKRPTPHGNWVWKYGATIPISAWKLHGIWTDISFVSRLWKRSTATAISFLCTPPCWTAPGKC